MDFSEIAVVAILALISLSGVVALFGLPIWLVVRSIRKRKAASLQSQDQEGPEPVPEKPSAEPSVLAEDNSPKEAPAVQEKVAVKKEERQEKLSLPSYSLTGGETLIRFAVVVIIGLCMLIPLSLIDGQAEERSEIHDEALTEVAKAWGSEQVIGAGSLIIPVTRTERQVSRSSDGTEKVIITPTKDALIVLPRSLSVSAKMDSEVRKKGIYEVVVYSAPLEVKGTFNLKGVHTFLAGRSDILAHWDQTYFSFGVSRAASLREVKPLNFDGEDVAFAPGARNPQLFEQGFHAPLGAEKPLVSVAQNDYSFAVSIVLKGSKGLSFLPLGENNTFHVQSNWPHPSFLGDGLPDEKTITDQGFSASWSIPSLTRSYQQVSLASSWPEKTSEGIVSAYLFEPVKLYGEIMRATRYGILFIALTFALFLASELRSTADRLHPVQYGMVGLAMASFYLLLLALAEHVPFAAAYIAASAVAVLMSSVYVGYIVSSKARAIRLGLGLSLLHAMLFVVLRMEDYSLLMGTALVLATLGLLMHSTRRLGGQS